MEKRPKTIKETKKEIIHFKYYCGTGHETIGYNSEGYCPVCYFLKQLEDLISEERRFASKNKDNSMFGTKNF